MTVVLLLLASACGRSNLLVGDEVAAQDRGPDREAMPLGGGSGTSRAPGPLAGAGSDEPTSVCAAGQAARAEQCNDVDDDCDDVVDEGFGLGLTCDGADSDLCLDDDVVCGGCSTGDDAVEVCNGTDDDCDGTIDADCELGDCAPALLVTEINSSMADCFVDTLPVGSRGELRYPCGGGPVTATFGPIAASGTVANGFVELGASTAFVWDDGCTWETTQRLAGALSAGTLSYTYSESTVSGSDCARPCTASGTIRVEWE